jgi:hypothetical protein
LLDRLDLIQKQQGTTRQATLETKSKATQTWNNKT